MCACVLCMCGPQDGTPALTARGAVFLVQTKNTKSKRQRRGKEAVQHSVNQCATYKVTAQSLRVPDLPLPAKPALHPLPKPVADRFNINHTVVTTGVAHAEHSQASVAPHELGRCSTLLTPPWLNRFKGSDGQAFERVEDFSSTASDAAVRHCTAARRAGAVRLAAAAAAAARVCVVCCACVMRVCVRVLCVRSCLRACVVCITCCGRLTA